MAAVEELPVQPRSVAALTRELLKRTHALFAANESQRPELDETRCALLLRQLVISPCGVLPLPPLNPTLPAQREAEALCQGVLRSITHSALQIMREGELVYDAAAFHPLFLQLRDEYAAVAHLLPPQPAGPTAAGDGAAGREQSAAQAGTSGNAIGAPAAPAAKRPKQERESALSKLIDEIPKSRLACAPFPCTDGLATGRTLPSPAPSFSPASSRVSLSHQKPLQLFPGTRCPGIP